MSIRQQRSSQQRVWLGFSFQRGHDQQSRVRRGGRCVCGCRAAHAGSVCTRLVKDSLTPDETWRSLSPSHGIATFPVFRVDKPIAPCRWSIDALKPPTTVVIRRFHQLLGKRKSGKVVGEMAIFQQLSSRYGTKSNGYAFLTQSLQPSSHGKSPSFSGQKHCITAETDLTALGVCADHGECESISLR